ncbi:MAG: hypothetical protein HY445_03730, partial [Candidatus Niyogibacteria bacterium]|nr:hypothetical protein [Candidatus Niyogibacteria bacterium]
DLKMWSYEEDELKKAEKNKQEKLWNSALEFLKIKDLNTPASIVEQYLADKETEQNLTSDEAGEIKRRVKEELEAKTVKEKE